LVPTIPRQIQHKDGDIDGRPDGIYMSTFTWSNTE
jgi:hypothetical protein